MKNEYVEKERVNEYINDMINSSIVGTKEINNARYNHNTKYTQAASVARNGILTLRDLNSKGIRKFTEAELRRFSDTSSHINGDDKISVAVMGLTDLYRDEDEYNSYDINKVNFVIDSEVKAHRSTAHYGNEFLCYESISLDKIRACDVRLLGYMNWKWAKTSELIDKYNELRNIAIALKENGYDICFREMSNGCNILDVNKVSEYPTLILK